MFQVQDAKYRDRKITSREQGIIVDVRDPELAGKVVVNCRTLGITNWIPYVMSPGRFQPPKVGDVVYVECDSGLEWAAVAHGKVPNVAKDPSGVQNSLYREVPTVAGWVSNGPLFSTGEPVNSIGPNGFPGHAILLDDGVQAYNASNTGASAGIKILSYGGHKIYLSDEPGNQKILIADLNNTSSPLHLDSNSGNRIVIDSEADTITIQDIHGNQVMIGTDSITINGATKSINIISNSTVTINSTGKTTINASEIDLNLGSGSPSASSSTVLTTTTDPIIDSIYGQPTMGVSTVKAGS